MKGINPSMDIAKKIQSHRDQILKLGSQYGASNIRIFGSISRDEGKPTSDLDIIVTLDPGHTLLDLGGFLMDIQEILGIHVDIVTDDSLHPLLKEGILREAKPL